MVKNNMKYVIKIKRSLTKLYVNTLKKIYSFYGKNTILFIIILLLLLLTIIHIYKKNVKRREIEGLAVIDDIKDAFSQLSKIKDLAEKIPSAVSSIKDDIEDSANVVKDSVNQIDNKLVDFSRKIKEETIDVVGEEVKKIDDKIIDLSQTIKRETIDVIEKEVKKLDDKILDFVEKIKKYTIDLVTEKIYNLLKQIGNIFNDGLVNPIVVLFKGIGNIFVGIFGILKEIVNKIISLPNCILPYMMFGIGSSIKSIYQAIIPEFIRNAIYTAHSYSLKYVTDKLYYFFGFDSYSSCYSFGVNSEIDKIENSAKKIGDAFSQDFGRLDFSKINI